MSSYIDIAVNLLGSALEPDIAQIIQAAADQGVSPLIVIGSDLSESAAAIQLCQNYLTSFIAPQACIPTMLANGKLIPNKFTQIYVKHHRLLL